MKTHRDLNKTNAPAITKRLTIPLLLVRGALLTGNAMAEQSGAGHYGSARLTDFFGTLPTQTGWVFGN